MSQQPKIPDKVAWPVIIAFGLVSLILYLAAPEIFFPAAAVFAVIVLVAGGIFLIWFHLRD
ncbi:hypothetical protein ABT337_17795 [Saccharopolyspora hirsuta]|uniref:hypothetical protein n=1 Tax=Saccharopolyspora hirsuta TaxID=1837 RepID=UPI003333D547